MDDPLIDEVRRVRKEISNEIGADMSLLVDRYAKLESRFAKPPLMLQNRPPIGGANSADGVVANGESSPAAT